MAGDGRFPAIARECALEPDLVLRHKRAVKARSKQKSPDDVIRLTLPNDLDTLGHQFADFWIERKREAAARAPAAVARN